MTHGANHGLSLSPEYNSWRHMKQRCTNPKRRDYEWYGARGITVCERWQDFDNFLADMGMKPGPKYTLDRRDFNGNYEPSNCKWSTKTEQNRNRRGVYTPEEDQKIREAIALGYNFRQMAEHVGKPQKSIECRTYYLGLKSGTPPNEKITDRKIA